MATRSSWKGFLRLSLVSIPVKAYTAASGGGGEISLNQLHADCHSRIRYQKTCPHHGEVATDQIVMGYEYAKGQYVVIDVDELDKLRSQRDRAIAIETFVEPHQIDPLYHTEKSYYLAPDGPAGQKSYALLQEAMAEKHLYAVAQVVLYNREQLVLLRPLGKLLCMTTLHFQAQIKPSSLFEEYLTPVTHTQQERTLVNLLIEATLPPFEYHKYTDVYTQRLTKLIETKVEGKELVAAPQEGPDQVINLMDALQASVRRAQTASLAATLAAGPTAPGKKRIAGAAPRRQVPAKRRTG